MNAFLKQAVDLLEAAVTFLIFTIIVKYILVRWIADQLKKAFLYYYVRSSKEMALWLHHVNRGLNRGHHHRSPLKCKDGRCVII